jgi:hypothetical protein
MQALATAFSAMLPLVLGPAPLTCGCCGRCCPALKRWSSHRGRKLTLELGAVVPAGEGDEEVVVVDPGIPPSHSVVLVLLAVVAK